MRTLSISLIAAAGLSPLLLLDTSSPATAGWTRAGAACAVASTPAVTAEYLEYHAMVAPLAVVPDRPSSHAACSPRKVIRT